jgi:hypothetical protein
VRQEGLRLPVGGEATQAAVTRIALSRSWRAQHNVLGAVGLNHMSEIIALERRHVPRAALRAIVVAHRGPFILPCRAAARADVVIAEPGHVKSRANRDLANDNDRCQGSRDIHCPVAPEAAAESFVLRADYVGTAD